MGRVLYFAVWLLLAPVLLLLSIVWPKLRFGMAERWAFRLPDVEPGSVWVHAASLGEGQVAAALFAELSTKTDCVRLRTVSTKAGYQNACGQHVLSMCPLDAPWVVRRWLDKVRPRVLILVEAELWPHLIRGCKKRNIPVFVAGWRSARGQKRFARWVPGLYRDTLQDISLISCRENRDAESLVGFGGSLVCDGGLKLDAPVADLPWAFPCKVVVAASTRSGDAERVLEAVTGLSQKVLLVVAPRRIDTAPNLVSMASKYGRVGLYTETPPENFGVLDILVVDRFGVLPALIKKADVVFVGGTFDQGLGGHSPAEAGRWGIPLVCGPHNWAHDHLWAELEHRVVAESDPESLRDAVEWGLNASRFEPRTGGTRAFVERLGPILEAPVPREGHERVFLWPFTLLWRGATVFRNWYWDRQKQRKSGCVISVGSLSTGGTGKTSVTLYLAQELSRKGKQVAVVARGYKRGPGPRIRLASESLEAGYLGDELAMVARRGIMVVSSPDRRSGVAKAFERGADVCVLDDAFQHRRVSRSLDVVVVDPEWAFGGGGIPMGAQREGLSGLKRADVVWVQGDADLPESFERRIPKEACLVSSRLRPVCWVSQGQHIQALDALVGQDVFAFAGIGRPGRFLRSVLEAGVHVQEWKAFPDHHVFSSDDLEALKKWSERGILVTTEKDLARLPAALSALALRVEPVVLTGEVGLWEKLDEVLAG